MTDTSCVFCQILAGDLPASVVHRDGDCTVFLDNHPLVEGHLLVVTNDHVATLAELTPELGAQLFQVAQRMANALRRSPIPCDGVNLLLSDGAAAMQEVAHVHLHVVPRHTGDGFAFQVPQREPPPRVQLDQAAASIRDGYAASAKEGLRLRMATARDVPFLRDLHHRVFRDVVVRQFGEWNEVEQDGWFEKSLQEINFQLVERDGALIGALGTSELVDCLSLAELQLLPEWQNQGIGSELLSGLFVRSRAAGKPIRLRVLQQNRARSLYERHGFSVVSQTETHYVMERAPGAPSRT